MGRLDQNLVYVEGKVLTAKVWDAKGREFTSASVTVDVSGTVIPLSVRLNITAKVDDRNAFNRIFVPGNTVSISKGKFSSYVPNKPDAKEVFQIEASIDDVAKITATEGSNTVLLSGKVVEAKGERAILESNYWSKGPNVVKGELKTRRVRVTKTGASLENFKDKNINLVGKITATKDAGPFVQADKLSVTE